MFCERKKFKVRDQELHKKKYIPVLKSKTRVITNFSELFWMVIIITEIVNIESRIRLILQTIYRLYHTN